MQTIEEKIANVIEKVKSLKEEKSSIERKNLELEDALRAKNQEIEKLTSEKSAIRTQIEDLLKELEGFELK